MKESRLCECGCGKRFYRRPNEGPARWGGRRFINKHQARERSNRARAVAHLCLGGCGQPLTPKPGQSPSHWRRAKYCDECRSEVFRRNAKLGGRPRKPPPAPPEPSRPQVEVREPALWLRLANAGCTEREMALAGCAPHEIARAMAVQRGARV